MFWAQGFKDRLELFWAANKVDVDGVEILQVVENTNVVHDVTEVCSQDYLRNLAAKAAQLLVGRLESILRLDGKVKDETWLVDLNGLCTSSFQLLEEVLVERKKLVEKRDRVN